MISQTLQSLFTDVPIRQYVTPLRVHHEARSLTRYCTVGIERRYLTEVYRNYIPNHLLDRSLPFGGVCGGHRKR